MAEIFPRLCAIHCRSPLPLGGFRKIGIGGGNGALAAGICSEISQLLGENLCAAVAMDDGRKIVVVFESRNKKRFSSILQSELEKLCRSSLINGKSPQITLEIDDDEISSGLLLQDAVRQSLVLFLIGQGWTSLQGGSFLVFGKLEEGSPIETIHLNVQLESNGHIVLLLSPDLTTYHLAKPAEDMPMVFKTQFDQNKFVSTEEYCLRCGDKTISDFECCVLPSLEPGYAVGFCRSLRSPEDQADMKHRLQLWSKQNGIRVAGECYYIKICFSLESNKYSWYPSFMVLKRSGLFPALPSLRCSKMLQVAQHFLKDASEWNCFGSGKTGFKELEICNSDCVPWTTATRFNNTAISFNGMKIDSFNSLEPENLIKNLRARETNDIVEAKSSINVAKAPTIISKPPLLVPIFKKRSSLTPASSSCSSTRSKKLQEETKNATNVSRPRARARRDESQEPAKKRNIKEKTTVENTAEKCSAPKKKTKTTKTKTTPKTKATK